MSNTKGCTNRAAGQSNYGPCEAVITGVMQIKVVFHEHVLLSQKLIIQSKLVEHK